jgi:hypothetical protein
MGRFYLIDLKGVLPLLSLPAELRLLILGRLFFVEVFMDDSFIIGDEVKAGTEGLEVLAATDLALHEFELIGDALHLVPESAVVLVVHVGVLHSLNEVVVVEEEEDAVLNGADLIVGACLDDEVEVEQVGLIPLLHILDVHDVVLEGEGAPLAEVANLALLEDDQVVVVVELLDDFVRMAYPHLKAFRQVVECLAHEGFEVLDVLEDLLIGFLQVLLLELHWQVADELLLLLEVEPLPEFGVLLDVVVDLPGEFLVESVLLGQFFEDLGALALLCVLAADVLDEGADAVDVVGEDEAAEGLDEDEAQGLLVVGGHDVPEADGEHHGARPVVRPDVLLLPARLPDPLYSHPVLLRTQVHHRRQQDADYVREAKVRNDDLHQRPVLLVVEILYPVGLQPLYLVQSLRKLHEDYSL